MYRYVAASVEGFVQQLAVGYVAYSGANRTRFRF